MSLPTIQDEPRRAAPRRFESKPGESAAIERLLQVPTSSLRNNRTVQRTINLSQLDPAFIAQLRDKLPLQTAECIQSTFGISANTWLKLCKGKPIRRSVAQRLLKRFAADC